MSFETQQVPSDNPSGYCRLCFSDRNLVALFPDGAEPQQLLLDLIFQSIGIEIKHAENHPSSICWRCAVALEDFHMFRQRSLNHDAIIQSKYTAVFEIRTVKEEVDWAPAECSTNVSESPLLEPEEDTDYSEAQSGSVPNENKIANNQIQSSDGNASENDNAAERPRTIPCNFDACYMMFVSQGSMQAHYKEQHSGRGRPFLCHLCQADFKRKTHLEDHLASHMGENRHQCKECDKTYARAKSLIHHRKVHHAYQPPTQRVKEPSNNDEKIQLKCTFCPKVFKHRASLHSHINTHTDKLAYECDQCDARFANKKGRFIHKGKYHSAYPSKKLSKTSWPCLHCPRVFDSRGNLRLHMRYIHHIELEKEQMQGMSVETTLTTAQNSEIPDNSDMGETNQAADNGQPLALKIEIEYNDL